MGLGDRLLTWLHDLWTLISSRPPVSFMLALFDDFRGIFEGKPADATKAAIDTLGSIPLPQTMAVAMLLSSLSGKGGPPQAQQLLDEAQKMVTDPAGYLAEKVRDIQSSGSIEGAASALAQLVDGQVFGALRQAAQASEQEPLVVAASIMSGIAAAKTAVHSIGVAVEIFGLGQIETVDTALEDILRSFNVEEIARLAVEPIFTNAITPAAERFYNKQFRPSRLNAEQLSHLLHFGVIDEGTLRDEAAAEGWRDEDIDRIEQLARNRITPSDALDAREVGQIGDGELFAKLKEFRYTDDDAQFMIELDARRRHQDWSERLFQIALRQFTNFRIDAPRLRQIGVAAGFSKERIDVEIEVAQATEDSLIQDLTVSEIESAYQENKLGRQEAITYLNHIHIDPSGIPILLETWDAKKKSGGTHLNAQKLTEAFRDDLINVDQFGSKLKALGWNAEDTRLIIKMAEYQKPAKPRDLSEAMIATAFVDGVLTRGEAIHKLTALDFTEGDAATILELHTILPAHKQKELTAAEVIKAAKLGAITEENALSRLVNMGYSEDDAALLYVVNTEKPAATKKTKVPAGGG